MIMNTQASENFEMAVDTSGVGPSTAVMTAPGSMDTSIAIGTPASPTPCERITVYAQSITPTEFSGGSNPVAAFDVVFSVGIQCDDGTCKTFQVVKRIGVDKCRIASEVENSTPVSIVEDKKPNSKQDDKKQLAEAIYRARCLAGLE